LYKITSSIINYSYIRIIHYRH